MANAQIIKLAEEMLSRLKSSSGILKTKGNDKEYLLRYESMVKEIIQLKEKQENLQADLLTVTFDLDIKIEEIMKNMEEVEKILNKNEKNQENIDELFGLI